VRYHGNPTEDERLDQLIEKFGRELAKRTSRRGALGFLGKFLLGGTVLPLLPCVASPAAGPLSSMRAMRESLRLLALLAARWVHVPESAAAPHECRTRHRDVADVVGRPTVESGDGKDYIIAIAIAAERILQPACLPEQQRANCRRTARRSTTRDWCSSTRATRQLHTAVS